MDQKRTVRFIPLGGLGEVGLNCFALEQGNDIIVVDCGVTFPFLDHGVDVIHPRFDYLIEHRDRLRGVVITHGHEDHIGALPYLLDALDVPVFAPAHAMELIRHRLHDQEFDLEGIELRLITPRVPFAVGSFQIEALRVTHSITEATALAITTHAGVVVHTGDFKLDPAPLDGELTDVARLRELGEAGVRLLLSDSTNVESRGHTASETSVGRAVDDLVGKSAGRVIVGMFPSNVQRLLGIVASAEKHDRKICLLGRSMSTHVGAAERVGKMTIPRERMVLPEHASSVPRDKLLVLSTGTQAEPPAALSRLATGTHPKLRLERGDKVILSSRIIPGNDRPVFDMMSNLMKIGVDLHTRGSDPEIHTSGHAHRDELAEMIAMLRPRAFVPVHGTLYHLTRHAELARSMNVAEVLVAENGDVVAFDGETAPHKSARCVTGRVSTFAFDALPEEVLRERATLGRHGIAVVVVGLGMDGAITYPPRLLSSGVLGPLSLDVHAIAERAALRSAKDNPGRAKRDVAEAIRIAARRAIEGETGQRPHVVVFDTAAARGD